jgi:hypothetical protein
VFVIYLFEPYEQLVKNIRRTKQAIHRQQGNGATGTSWKKFHNGGMLEESLRNDALHVTIIGDGFHISKQYVRDWIARKVRKTRWVRGCCVLNVRSGTVALHVRH